MRSILFVALWAAPACTRAAAATADLGSVAEPRRDRLVINEVAAAGEPADWFEVVNAGDRALDLSDFVFVDAEGALDRARSFPGFVLAPGERHVEEVITAVDGFQLGRGEALFLYRADRGALVDAVDWDPGAAPRGGSYARIPDVTGGFRTEATDTRGEPN